MDEMKKARKHFSQIGLRFFISAVIIFAVQLIPFTIAAAVNPEWTTGNIGMVLQIVPMYLIGMPILILLIRKVPAVSLEKHDMKIGHWVLCALMCFGITYFSNIIGNVITMIISMFKGGAVQNTLMNAASAMSLPLVFLYMVILAPVMEEYIFRKLLIDRTARYGQGVAVVVSGLMFGLFHGNLNQFAYAFGLGVFFAFVYVKTGKVKYTIALHMIINFMGSFVSSIVMRMVDLQKYQELALSGDMEGLMTFLSENAAGIAAYMMLLVFVFGSMVSGIILLIVFLAKRRFTLNRGEVVIPKGQRFTTVICNVGMILYCVFWIGMMIAQLMG